MRTCSTDLAFFKHTNIQTHLSYEQINFLLFSWKITVSLCSLDFVFVFCFCLFVCLLFVFVCLFACLFVCLLACLLACLLLLLLCVGLQNSTMSHFFIFRIWLPVEKRIDFKVKLLCLKPLNDSGPHLNAQEFYYCALNHIMILTLTLTLRSSITVL